MAAILEAFKELNEFPLEEAKSQLKQSGRWSGNLKFWFLEKTQKYFRNVVFFVLIPGMGCGAPSDYPQQLADLPYALA